MSWGEFRRFAIVDCGLMPWEYEELTFYDLMLFIEKVNQEHDKEKARFENTWNQVRIIWAAIKNLFRGKTDRIATPQDLITLSFDPKEEEVIQEKLTFKEAKERLGSTFKKGTIK